MEKFGQFKGTVNLRSLLSWDTAQHRLAVVCQFFQTAYLSHLQESSSP